MDSRTIINGFSSAIPTVSTTFWWATLSRDSDHVSLQTLMATSRPAPFAPTPALTVPPTRTHSTRALPTSENDFGEK